MKYLATVNGQTFEVELTQDGKVIVNGQAREVDFRQITESLYSALINNKSVEALVEQKDRLMQVVIQGDLYEVEVLDERQQRLMRASSGFGVTTGELIVKAPMPGLIVAVRVEQGQEVQKGQPLIVLESMKMENDIKAPRAGLVEKIHVSKGESVEQNKVLITLV
ncbi:MAG: acetyl-CoA carboxylase biotin carboxyl carrier protein subunit [Anaerolineae bacterium]